MDASHVLDQGAALRLRQRARVIVSVQADAALPDQLERSSIEARLVQVTSGSQLAHGEQRPRRALVLELSQRLQHSGTSRISVARGSLGPGLCRSRAASGASRRAGLGQPGELLRQERRHLGAREPRGAQRRKVAFERGQRAPQQLTRIGSHSERLRAPGARCPPDEFVGERRPWARGLAILPCHGSPLGHVSANRAKKCANSPRGGPAPRAGALGSGAAKQPRAALPSAGSLPSQRVAYSFEAAWTIASAVMPSSFITCPPGAERPKRLMPMTVPSRPT